jgi:uncharacterized membrane protein
MLAFGDAVVAIAITLVALPLIERAGGIGRDGTGKFIADSAFALISAGVSFAALYALWRAHHSLFTQARGYTSTIVWLNGLWLACAVALPIATVLVISSGGQDRVSSSLYVLTVTVAITSTEAIGWQMNRHHLLNPHSAETERTTFARLLLPILSTAALVVVLFLPQLYLWPLVLLLAERPILSLHNRLRGRRRTQSPKRSGSAASSSGPTAKGQKGG